MDLRSLTKLIWMGYFLGDEQVAQEMLSLLAPECTIIGTGRHELYHSAQEFTRALKQEIAEREGIRFQLKDFWCEETPVSEQVHLVYGGIHIWWKGGDPSVCIDMDSRFTMVYRRQGDHWQLIHVHQSMPNLQQMEEEYYVKTLSTQVENSLREIEMLTRLAQNDSLTGLMNYQTFTQKYNGWTGTDSWFLVIDIDNFKRLNDTCGHLAGNYALQWLSQLLTEAIRPGDLVCRMGGDEFLLLCSGLSSQQQAADLAQSLLRRVEAEGSARPGWDGISIGITLVREAEPLEHVFKRADQALYRAKRSGKNQFFICLAQP